MMLKVESDLYIATIRPKEGCDTRSELRDSIFSHRSVCPRVSEGTIPFAILICLRFESAAGETGEVQARVLIVVLSSRVFHLPWRVFARRKSKKTGGAVERMAQGLRIHVICRST